MSAMTAAERSQLVAEIVDEFHRVLDLDARICALEASASRPTPHMTPRSDRRHLKLVTSEERPR